MSFPVGTDLNFPTRTYVQFAHMQSETNDAIVCRSAL
jgi:hypothetical protein